MMVQTILQVQMLQLGIITLCNQGCQYLAPRDTLNIQHHYKLSKQDRFSQ